MTHYKQMPPDSKSRSRCDGCAERTGLANLLGTVERFKPLLITICLGLTTALSAGAAAAPLRLEWNTQRERVSADIQSADLMNVLQKLSRATGWKIFVEPESQHTVSAKFKDVTPGEALRFLLGDLNFALVPGTNSASRLFVFRTARQNATELIPVGRVSGKPIPNELIIRVRPGVDVEALAKTLGAKVVGRLDKLNAYRLQFADEEAANAARERLAANPEVASVENNYAIDVPPNPLGQQQGLPGFPSLQMRPPPDSGRVIVGLVDTAVQPLGHDLDQFLLRQQTVAGPSQVNPGEPSHGTAMAETILRSLEQITGGSTSVQILPVDVYGRGETTSTFDVANGIIQAVNGGARVINLSLGSPADSLFLHDVVRLANDNHILLIGAAGNEPVATPFYPAAYPEVHAVTAIDHGQLASYASRGPFVTLAAPGMNLILFGAQAYGVEGTSVSSAIISGAVAGFMEANRANSGQAQTFLQNNFGVNPPGGH
jgi:hypothetical protein